MQTAGLRLMGKKLLVALTMEGKFAGEGLQNIDEDDDMLSAMARELVERNGIGESADAVWKTLNAEHQKLFPTASQSVEEVGSPESSGECASGPLRCSCGWSGTDRFQFGSYLRTQTRIGQETTRKAVGTRAGLIVRVGDLTYQSRSGMHRVAVSVNWACNDF